MITIPTTTTGKWSVLFGTIFAALIAISLLVATFISQSTIDQTNHPLIISLNLLLNLTGALSFIIGLYSFIKYKDWLVVKYLAVVYGLALIMFLLGEFLFPH